MRAMSPHYSPLSHTLLDAGVSYQRPHQTLPDHLDADAPAVNVMTDLSMVAAVTIAPDSNLEEAEKCMIACGIRLLLVTNGNDEILGILTAKDLEGDRAMAQLSHGGLTRRELTVDDIMTPRHQIEVLEMNDMTRARVGDVVETLKRMGRQHALVIDRGRDGQQTVRGILSTTQIARQLGQPIDVTGVAHSMVGLVQTVAGERAPQALG
jgi:CBS domain containing-hemolysin-like protein